MIQWNYFQLKPNQENEDSNHKFMEDFLDEIEVGVKRSRTYSILSLIAAVMTLMLYGYFSVIGPESIEQIGEEYQPFMAISIGIIMSSIGGLVVTILSFVKKEANYFKWITGAINMLFFLFLLGSFIIVLSVGIENF